MCHEVRNGCVREVCVSKSEMGVSGSGGCVRKWWVCREVVGVSGSGGCVRYIHIRLHLGMNDSGFSLSCPVKTSDASIKSYIET